MKNISIRWFSDFPVGIWVKVVFVDPLKCRLMKIPIMAGDYSRITSKMQERDTFDQWIVYEAYFDNEFLSHKRVFDLVLPYYKWRRVMGGVQTRFISAIKGPISVELRKTRRKQIHCRNWNHL